MNRRPAPHAVHACRFNLDMKSAGDESHTLAMEELDLQCDNVTPSHVDGVNTCSFP